MSDTPWYDKTNFLAQTDHFGWAQVFMLYAAHFNHIYLGLLAVQLYAVPKELYDGLRPNDPDPWKQNIFDWAVWTVSSLIAFGILYIT